MTAPAAPSQDELRGIDLSAELADDELQAWSAVASVRQAEQGEVVVEQGQGGSEFILLLEGEIQAYLDDGGRLEPVGRHVAPTWMGAIPVLTESAYGVRMVAETPCRIATVAAGDFERLVFSQRPCAGASCASSAP